MDEYAVLWALRMFRGYIEREETPQRLLRKPVIFAGSIKLVYELREWFMNGNLRLTSAAAPELIKEYYELNKIMETHVTIQPHQMKDEVEDMEELPAVQKGQLQVAEEFRVIA